jgi:hypothetical protein
MNQTEKGQEDPDKSKSQSFQQVIPSSSTVPWFPFPDLKHIAPYWAESIPTETMESRLISDGIMTQGAKVIELNVFH